MLNTIVCALRYYYGKLLGDYDRVATLPTPSKSGQLGELLTVSELRRLFAAASGPKHRAVLGLLYGLGLRAGEVARLRLHDFDRELRTLIVRNGKGGKDRVLPYDEGIRRLLIAHFRTAHPTDYLFTSDTRPGDSDGITVRGVQYIVRCTRARAGLLKKVCPHTLRHNFAVHYLERGGNLVRLKQLLGHAHISTTLRYLSYANPELRDIPSPVHFLFHA